MPPRVQGPPAKRTKIAVAEDAPPINVEYLKEVSAIIMQCTKRWPDLINQLPLPVKDWSAKSGVPIGFIEPYSAAAFDNSMKACSDMKRGLEYTCGVNMFWFAQLQSATPHVPVSKQRVVAAAMSLDLDRAVDPPLTANIDWTSGDKLPRGGMLRVSPEEIPHALLFRAKIAFDDGDEQALDKIRRLFLSTPCKFVKLSGGDEIFAEANSLRARVGNIARVVTLSARQVAYNIAGFKLRKEAENLGKTFGAVEISKFWDDHVEKSQSGEQCHKKATIDAALTVHKRLLSIPSLDNAIAESENTKGPDSCWNSLYKLQEIVWRCRGASQMLWLIASVDDKIQGGMMTDQEVSIQALKSQSLRSISDPAMMRFALKRYLLGEWLDGKRFPAYMKLKAREIFENHTCYRALLAELPGGARPDTTWLRSWPPVGRLLINFFEATLFASSPQEESTLRMAVKNQKSEQDVLTFSPWAEQLLEIEKMLLTTGNAEIVHPNSPPVPGTGESAKGSPEEDGAADGLVVEGEDDRLTRLTSEAAARIINSLTFFFAEPNTKSDLTAVLKASPLAMAKSGVEEGSMVILMDCNTYGEPDQRPWIRAVQVSPPGLYQTIGGRGGGAQRRRQPSTETRSRGFLHLLRRR